MDGLKRAPLECCEFEGSWLDAVLPALRGRMESLSRSGEIRFNLLAIVPSVYQSKVDELELGKRKITFLERRLLQEFGDSWKTLVGRIYFYEFQNSEAKFRFLKTCNVLRRRQFLRACTRGWESGSVLARTMWPWLSFR